MLFNGPSKPLTPTLNLSFGAWRIGDIEVLVERQTSLRVASIGETPAMRQHQPLAQFQTIENRRYFQLAR